VHSRLGRHDLAIGELGEALLLFEEIGHRYDEASTLNVLGEVLYAAGRPAEAAARHAAALTIAVETGDRDEQARAHRGVARAESHDGLTRVGPGR
jgi:uncharacterized protein HemY